MFQYNKSGNEQNKITRIYDTSDYSRMTKIIIETTVEYVHVKNWPQHLAKDLFII